MVIGKQAKVNTKKVIDLIGLITICISLCRKMAFDEALKKIHFSG